MVDGTGVHHHMGMGTNGISARALRSNNGQSSVCACVSVWVCMQMFQKTYKTLLTECEETAVLTLSQRCLHVADLLKLAC